MKCRLDKTVVPCDLFFGALDRFRGTQLPLHREFVMVIWTLRDGKAGHENQTTGLVAAIARRVPVEEAAFTVEEGGTLATTRAVRAFGKGRPKPDLLIGAGHRTHGALLAARLLFGGKAIVLMKPSLPVKLFDLCIVPRHDGIPESPKVVLTRGVLNKIAPGGEKDPSAGLILVGGPSKDFSWNEKNVVRQIRAIAEASPDRQWTAGDSRRTPEGFLVRLKDALSQIAAAPVSQTGPDWLPRALARSSVVWVTEDSVSMVYEALTSGARVGLLGMPRERTDSSRVIAGAEELATDGWVTPFAKWEETRELPASPDSLQEADRCAAVVLERFGKPGAATA